MWGNLHALLSACSIFTALVCPDLPQTFIAFKLDGNMYTKE